MRTKSETLKSLRIKSGRTLEEIGKFAGVSKQNLHKYESGIITNIPSDKIEKLANLYNVTPAYIMGWEIEDSADEETVNIPIYGNIACGKGLMIAEEVLGYEATPKDWLNGGEYFYLVAEGDSMTGARIHDGDLLLIRKQAEVEDGQIAAVLIEEDCVMKRVYRSNGTLILQSENPAHAPIVKKSGNVKVIGKLDRIIIKM